MGRQQTEKMRGFSCTGHDTKSYLSRQQPADADEEAEFGHAGARGSCEPGPSASLDKSKALDR